MFNKHNLKKNSFMLNGKFKKKGYDWWWHSFTGIAPDGTEQPFFVEYFIVNPKVSPDKIGYGRLGDKPSYVMVKCGAWGKNKVQLHKFYKISDVKITKYPYKLEHEDFFASDSLIKGKVEVKDSASHKEYMCDDGSMEWNLNIKKDIAYNVGYGTSGLFRFLKAFQMYWHAEGMKSYFDGYVILNGIRYEVKKESSYGYADKNWGSDFTSPWVWLSSNNLYSNISHKKLENSVFDIGGGRPKVYFIPFNKKLLSAFYLEGKEYEFNFSKFWTRVKTKFNCQIEGDKLHWYVWQRRKGNIVMETNIYCYLADMLFVNYEAPNGKKLHNKLYNGGNGFGNVKLYRKNKLIEDIECKNVGCEFGEYDKLSE